MKKKLQLKVKRLGPEMLETLKQPEAPSWPGGGEWSLALTFGCGDFHARGALLLGAGASNDEISPGAAGGTEVATQAEWECISGFSRITWAFTAPAARFLLFSY